MGRIFREEMEKLPKEIVKVVRGLGLMNAIILDESMYWI